ncbi:FMN-binding negative transcriptional regulator [Acidiphilium iwatense]|uniref:FMN-binding negative transcriptional regulator n=1 Tax=Acidiphilium iwatense TaxID=768198 RepID=A0ABS9DXM7_9PROT|nr:FMN-binding negative transcriptional regulator [Acidiphilium iwatense]MCF3947491.1 FMN-binding negative transcriptional regulator [Acidiphilium iwatense]
MYTPPAFRENDQAEIVAIMRSARLPILVSAGDAGLIATHLPLIHDAEPAPHGRLIGHVARANPQWHALRAGAAAMAIFQAHDFYVSPNWYATKRETGRVVPTWNYEAVHAYGTVEIIEAAEPLRAIVSRLTDRHEAAEARPWHVEDAPPDYIASQLKGIVGVVVTITRIVAKRKLSQNRPEADRRGVIAALEAAGQTEPADLMLGLENAADRPGPEPIPQRRE